MPEKSPRHRNRNRSPEQVARTRRIHLLWLSLVVFLVFAASLGGGFVWSDREDILGGAHRLTGSEDVYRALVQTRDAYRARESGALELEPEGSWQPLTLLSNSLSWGLWGDCASCFHLENLLFHLLTAIGLYALGRHLLAHRRNGHRLAAWSAALFAVHPATVSSVAWIGGRPYLLASLLMVLSLVAFSRLQATTNAYHRHLRRWLIAAPGLAVLAALAHETAFLLPLLALLVASAASRERGRSALTGIAPVRLASLGLIVAALLLVVAYRTLVMGGIGFSGSYPTDSFAGNLGTGLRHFWYLVDQTLLPTEPVVSDAWPVTLSWGATEVLALLGLLLVLGATGYGLYLGHPAAVGTAWFLLAIVPGVGLFPSDHYHNSHTLYLATWGLTFAFVVGVYQLWRPVGRQLMPGSEGLIMIPVVLLLGLLSAFSTVRWWDHDRLFEGEIATDPHYMEGRLELAKSALARGDAGSAVNHLMAAFEAAQDKQFTGYWRPAEGYLLLGTAYMRLDRHTEAANSFNSALELAPGKVEIQHGLALAQIALGNLNEAEALLRTLASGDSALAATAGGDLGAVLAMRGQTTEAEPLLLTALQSPGGDRFLLHRAMARVHIDLGRYQAALNELESALEVREDAEERARLAWVAWHLGERERAEREINLALQTDESENAYVSRVWREIGEAGKTSAGPSTEGAADP
jgi:Flp pilus assembly protein TadD